MIDNKLSGTVTMTVGELLAALDGCNRILPVITEGCDCAGGIGSVQERDGTVYLFRPDYGTFEYEDFNPRRRVDA